MWKRILGIEELHRRGFVHHALGVVGHAVGIRAEVVIVLPVLYCTTTTPPFLHVVEQAAVVGGQFGPRRIGAHAQHDHVELLQVALRQVLRAQELRP